MHLIDSTAVEFDLAHRSYRVVKLHELAIDLKDKNKIYWVHSNLNQTDEHQLIVEKLGLPPEIRELCKQSDSMPKLIDSDDTVTIQIQCLKSIKPVDNEAVQFNNLIIYITDKFCFTATSEAIPLLSEFIKSYPKSIKYAKTSCFILFLLMDFAVDDYARVLFNFELVSDHLENELHKNHHTIYNDVMNVKQQVMYVKRNAIATREILSRISGHKISVISEQCQTSLYNLANHNHMIVHEADSIRDMLNGLLDQIDNALMQRLSETMKILTIFSAIFLPLTLIAGIYGMNFHWIPELAWKYGYFYALGLIATCAAVLLIIFKKMKWF